jgi:hypothetical protein
MGHHLVLLDDGLSSPEWCYKHTILTLAILWTTILQYAAKNLTKKAQMAHLYIEVICQK